VRIKALRLSWFRGAADAVTLGAEGKSMGVYGCNGAGKSSFVDSVEYGIKGGKIGHLVSEYSGRHQEKAIPNTHTPANCNTGFSIKFQDDSELNVNIARNGTHTRAGADAVKMQEWDYRRIVLRQDEVAEFIRSRKGDKYSALLPLFGLHELEVAAENLRQLAKAIDQQGKLQQKQGALGQIAVQRKQAFGEAKDAAIEGKIAELHGKYCPAGAATAAFERCKEVEAALASCIGALTDDNKRYLSLRTIAELEFATAVKAVRDANAKLAGSVEPLISEKLAVLQSADAFAAKLEDTGEIHCPACGKPVEADEFKAHVKAEQERLRDIITVFEERRSAVAALIDRVKTLKAALAKPELAEWRAKAKDTPVGSSAEWIAQCEAESYRRALREDHLVAVGTHCPSVVAAANEASRDAPPDLADLAKDKATIDAAKSVIDSRTLVAEIARIEGLIAFVEATEAGVRTEIRERAETVIGEISADIGAMWKALHPGEPIEDVRLYLPEEDKAIDIALRFHGKDQDSPRLTLSEGYRNSLGLCIFLALAKREAGDDRPLILDVDRRSAGKAICGSASHHLYP
jgi:hypothetical protein